MRAQHGYYHQKEAESDGPGGEPVGVCADSVRHAGAWTSTRIALAGCGRLDKHQAPPRTDLPNSTSYRRSIRLPDLPAGPILAIAATLDPLAHILDISPPGAGLGCSWHLDISFATAYGVS
jgi:hypothetical protein